MDSNLIRTKLVEVLQEIQSASGLGCPAISGTTKPLEALPEFDSKIWPVAIGMLAVKLAINIPADVNIFRLEKGCIALTVDQTVEMVKKLAVTQPSTAAKMEKVG